MANYALFPSVSYFLSAAKLKNLTLFPEDNENFYPYYQIGGANQIETLRVPITADTKLKPIEEWEISYETKWLREHQNAWKTAYGKSPFYHYYHYKLEAVLALEISSFRTLHAQLVGMVLPWIGLEDLWNHTPDATDRKWLVEPEYRDYYQVFETKFGHRKDLSIIDLIFNLGPESIRYFSH